MSRAEIKRAKSKHQARIIRLKPRSWQELAIRMANSVIHYFTTSDYGERIEMIGIAMAIKAKEEMEDKKDGKKEKN